MTKKNREKRDWLNENTGKTVWVLQGFEDTCEEKGRQDAQGSWVTGVSSRCR
jgi:hypothetical protein